MSDFLAVLIILSFAWGDYYGSKGVATAIEEIEFIDMETCEYAKEAVLSLNRETSQSHIEVRAVCVTR